MEDVASIVVSGFSASVHGSLLIEAAKHGLGLVFCQNYKPASVLLPANRSTDTMLTRAQTELSPKASTRLWTATIDAKCGNQLATAARMYPNKIALDVLCRAACNPSAHKEATCAKLYWQYFSKATGHSAFTRDRKLPGLNSFLNYGYAVLLSVVLQKLFALGIDPTFGIAHATRERSTPLAYDLMEPFRPLVDWRIFEWLQTNEKLSDDETVSKKLRQWITGFLLKETAYCNATIQVHSCIEAVVRSFRRALREKNPTLYKPWTLKNSRWAG
jgi:CRISPR-associated protein Cas1